MGRETTLLPHAVNMNVSYMIHSIIWLVAKLTMRQRSFCAGNGAERHRLPPLGKLRAVSLSKRQTARRVAVATASNLSFVARGGTAWSKCGGVWLKLAHGASRNSRISSGRRVLPYWMMRFGVMGVSSGKGWLFFFLPSWATLLTPASRFDPLSGFWSSR